MPFDTLIPLYSYGTPPRRTMKLFTFLAAGHIFALMPALGIPSLSEKINVILLQNKVSSEVSVTAFNGNYTGLLGQSCSFSLGTGAFENWPITFKVDLDGFGKLIVGSESFEVLGLPKGVGSIDCDIMNSTTDSLVACTINTPAFKMTPAQANRQLLSNCFSDGTIMLASVLWLPAPASVNGHSADISSIDHGNFNNSIGKRQGPCAIWTPDTIRVGDGDPYQAPLHVQVSVRLHPLPTPSISFLRQEHH